MGRKHESSDSEEENHHYSSRIGNLGGRKADKAKFTITTEPVVDEVNILTTHLAQSIISG